MQEKQTLLCLIFLTPEKKDSRDEEKELFLFQGLLFVGWYMVRPH